MRRMLLTLTLLAALLTGCGGQPAAETADPPPAPPSGEAAEPPSAPQLTEADVLTGYAEAAMVYDWFTLSPLPQDIEDTKTEGDMLYYRVEHPGITSMADLRAAAEQHFTPELVDELFANAGDLYRDFDGVLYTVDGGRGSNLYLLDKQVSARQTGEDHWAVTVTAYADSYAWEQPSVTIGYSQTALDYQLTDAGWRFASFVPSDDLDLDAETAFQFTYDPDSVDEAEMAGWSDLELACWLLHADGAFSEGPSDTLTRRFLENPEDWFAALAPFPGSPWENAKTVMTAPVYDTFAWYGQEEQARLDEILEAYQPKDSSEQALLDALRAARETVET